MDEITTVVFPLFPGVTQLDFTGPFQVLARAKGLDVIAASMGGKPIASGGLTFSDLARLEDVQRCDVLCVPGGGVTGPLQDDAFIGHVRRLASGARYVTSVCNGSLLLGAAGLLEGKRAACHWLWRDMLPLFGAIPDPARVVRDGNTITGGGITAGIDFALTLVAELTDETTAQSIQLMLEYAPAPPFEAGRPDTAPPHVVQLVTARDAETLPARDHIMQRAAAAYRQAGAPRAQAG